MPRPPASLPAPPKPAARGVALRATALAALGVFLASPVAFAEGVRANYTMTLAGLPLGQASLSADIDGDRYKLDVTATLGGLAALVTSGRGSATATGLVSGAKPSPSGYALTSSNGSETRTVRFTAAGGAVQGVEIKPPLDPQPDRVPVTDAHKRNIVDPVSALMMPVAGPSPSAPAVAAAPGAGAPAAPSRDAAVCDRTLPVFDGATRFDVRLTYAGTRDAKAGDFQGPAVVCRARYVPVSGHRPSRKATQFMADNKDMEVWLAPVATAAGGARIYAPLRIAVRTMVGQAVIQASSFQIDASRRAAVR